MNKWIDINGQPVELPEAKENFFVLIYTPWDQRWALKSRHSTADLAIEKLRDDWEYYFPGNEARDPILNGMKLRAISADGKVLEIIESKPLIEKNVA